MSQHFSFKFNKQNYALQHSSSIFVCCLQKIRELNQASSSLKLQHCDTTCKANSTVQEMEVSLQYNKNQETKQTSLQQTEVYTVFRRVIFTPLGFYNHLP